jgi:small subunit ribosomal protein S16
LIFLWTFFAYVAKNTSLCKNMEIFVALKIRLARSGAKKHPFYRVVVTDSRNSRDGSFLERVGSYDPFLPHDNSRRVVANADRVKYWMSVGAKLSNRVAVLLSKLQICERPAVIETPKKSSPRKKTLEKLQQAQSQASPAAAE